MHELSTALTSKMVFGKTVAYLAYICKNWHQTRGQILNFTYSNNIPVTCFQNFTIHSVFLAYLFKLGLREATFFFQFSLMDHNSLQITSRYKFETRSLHILEQNTSRHLQHRIIQLLFLLFFPGFFVLLDTREKHFC